MSLAIREYEAEQEKLAKEAEKAEKPAARKATPEKKEAD